MSGSDPDRVSWIGAPDAFNLNHACASIAESFGHCGYLVGSACRGRDYRDIDIRWILSDEDFDAMFSAWANPTHDANPRLSLMNAALSEWLRKTTGLPVDFQFQRQTEANRDYPTCVDDRQVIDGVEHVTRVRIRPRVPVGFFMSKRREDP